MLLERGGNRPPESDNIMTTGDALRTDCADDFFSDGVVVSTGNCMGGGTSYNGGVYIEEQRNWIADQLDGYPFFDESEIDSAFMWVRSLSLM